MIASGFSKSFAYQYVGPRIGPTTPIQNGTELFLLYKQYEHQNVLFHVFLHEESIPAVKKFISPKWTELWPRSTEQKIAQMNQISQKVGDNSVHLGDMTFSIAGIDSSCKNRPGTTFWIL